MNQHHDTTLNRRDRRDRRDRRRYFLMFFCELGVLRGDRCDRPLLNQQVPATTYHVNGAAPHTRRESPATRHDGAAQYGEPLTAATGCS